MEEEEAEGEEIVDASDEIQATGAATALSHDWVRTS